MGGLGAFGDNVDLGGLEAFGDLGTLEVLRANVYLETPGDLPPLEHLGNRLLHLGTLCSGV